VQKCATRIASSNSDKRPNVFGKSESKTNRSNEVAFQTNSHVKWVVLSVGTLAEIFISKPISSPWSASFGLTNIAAKRLMSLTVGDFDHMTNSRPFHISVELIAQSQLVADHQFHV
jgi:hypothetical protein